MRHGNCFKLAPLATALFAWMLLAGCGGGSQSSSSTTATANPSSPGTTAGTSPSPGSAPPSTGTSGTTSGGTSGGSGSTGTSGTTSGGTSGGSAGSGGTTSGGTSGGSGSTGSGGTASGGTSGGSGSTGSGSGSGTGSGSGSGTPNVTQWLYVLETGNSVEQFNLDSNTGALSSASMTTNGISDRTGNIAVDPKSQYVFLGISAPGSNLQAGCFLFSYAIGANGVLSLVDQEKLQNNCDTIQSMALDPSGSNLYVSWNAIMTSGATSTYTLNRSTGKLTNSAPDVGMTATAMPGKVLVYPGGNYVYVARLSPHHYPGDNGWELYLRDPVTGALTKTGQYVHGPNISDEYLDGAVAFSGKYLFGTSGGGYSVWAINPATGTLTYLRSQVDGSNGVVADPGGNYVIMSQNSGPVISYHVNADGSLTQAGGQNAGSGAFYLTFDPTGRYLYVDNPSTSQIFAFKFDDAGLLATVTGSPFATKGVPVNIVTAGHQ